MKTRGQCGERVFYQYDNGRLIIEGTGPMWDFMLDMTEPGQCSPFDNTLWWPTPVLHVLVRSGVTRIGNGAFCCMKLRTVMLPETVTEIGCLAFANSELKQIWLPDSLRFIESLAFYGCKSLQHVELPANIRLSSYSFAWTGLRQLQFRGKLASVGCMAFWLNFALTEVKLPPCGPLSYGLFECCGLTRADLSESGLETLPEYLFSFCSHLETVLLPPQMRSFGTGCFFSTGLTELVLPAKVEEFHPGDVMEIDKLRQIVFLGKKAPNCSGFSSFSQKDLNLVIREDAEGFDVMPWSGQATVRMTESDMERMKLL